MNLATVLSIDSLIKHPNADSLEICKIKNWEVIVKLGEFQIGEKICFIAPDSVLPDVSWAAFYKAKSKRVRAIKLRNSWSYGIVEKLERVGLDSTYPLDTDVTERLGIIKYCPPEPQDLQAKGQLPFGIGITDEENWQNLDEIPYGQLCEVSLKIDGKSWTAYAAKRHNEWFTGICGRKLEYKLECPNDYTNFQDILPRLLEFAKLHDKSIAIRAECHGAGIQAHKINPHSNGEKKISVFSVWLIDERKYVSPWRTVGLSYREVARALGLEAVPLLEICPLTKELIYKYSEGINEIGGRPFEGVVVKGDFGSFKIINKSFDSQK